MTVYFDKHRRQWRYSFRLDGKRYAARCPNTVTCRRAAEEVEREARQVAKMAPKLPRAADLTFLKVVTDLCEQWKDKADWSNKQRYARELVAYFKPETPVRAIDGAMVDDYKAWAQQQPVMIWTGGSTHRKDDPEADKYWKPHPDGKKRGPATVNRYLPILRMVFERAHKTRDPITGARAIEDVPEIKDLSELKRKPRPAPDNVISSLMDVLPDYVVDAIRATLYFGFRRGEIFTLQIGNVDFDLRGIRLDAAAVKDDEDAFLPGGADAMQLMARLVDQAKERGVTHLITYRRWRKDEKDQEKEPWRPIKNPKSAWRTAMAKIEKTYGKRWRWHDLRAAFITHVALTSGPLPAQRLARHSDFETTQAYIEVASEILRDAAEKVAVRPALGVISGGKSGRK